MEVEQGTFTTLIFSSTGRMVAECKQGGRKEGRGNEPVGSCAMCDARSTGSRALEGKNR